VIGTLLRARYEVLQEIGDSPVFRSFVAHDRVAERNVVVRIVKSPYSEEQEFITRLKAVFEKSKRPDHARVARAIEMDEDGGTWFLVYQYSPGTSLGERMKRASAMGVSTAVTTVLGVLEGLDALHKCGLVHGEVSVRNVVLSNSGDPTVINPCVWEAYSSSDTAGAEMLALIAPYLAPEVALGSMPSPASDVYAVGVMLYELLTGNRPFSGRTPADVARAHETQDPPSIKDKVAAAPEALEKIMDKALSKDPLDRYKDAGAMLADVRLLQDAMRFGKPLSWPLKPVSAAPPGRVGPKLNVVRGEQKEQKVAMKRAKDTGDGMPAWLVYIGVLLMSGAVLAIGWWAYFNLTAPQTLKVPNIVGMSFSEAGSQLDRMNLKLRKVREAPSEELAEGIVVSVQPSVGRDVKEYSFVDAVVSSGSKMVEVPDLSGKTLEEARQLLASMGLTVSRNIRYVRTTRVPEGHVVSQNPRKHTQAERKSAVVLDVSEGAPPDEAIPPPASTYVYHLSWTLPDMAGEILVRVDMTDNAGTRTIFEDMKGPNSKIEINAEGLGSKATFHIFYDNELVQTVVKSARDEDTIQRDGQDPPVRRIDGDPGGDPDGDPDGA